MIGPFDSLDAYKRYLVGIGAFRAPIEARLRQALWPAALETFPLQEFSLLIQRDQEDLASCRPSPGSTGAASDGREPSAARFWARCTFWKARRSALACSTSVPRRWGSARATAHVIWPRRPCAAIAGRVFLHTLEAADAIEIDEVALASRVAFAEAREAFRQALHGA